MAKTFFADMIANSKMDGANARLEIALSDAAGQVQTVSLGPDALAALIAIASQAVPADAGRAGRLTKLPTRYAVGHGRHEPVVMLRFEDEPAYGLTVSQAEDIAEALLEQAEAIADTKYCMRQ